MLMLTFQKFGTDSHEVGERLPELLGHQAVEDEVDGRVDERHHVHEVPHRMVAAPVELASVDGVQETHNSLRVKKSRASN